MNSKEKETIKKIMGKLMSVDDLSEAAKSGFEYKNHLSNVQIVNHGFSEKIAKLKKKIKALQADNLIYKEQLKAEKRYVEKHMGKGVTVTVAVDKAVAEAEYSEKYRQNAISLKKLAERQRKEVAKIKEELASSSKCESHLISEVQNLRREIESLEKDKIDLSNEVVELRKESTNELIKNNPSPIMAFPSQLDVMRVYEDMINASKESHQIIAELLKRKDK